MAVWNDTSVTWNSASAAWDSSGGIFPTAIASSSTAGVAAPRLAGWLLKGSAAGSSLANPRLVGWLLKGSAAGSSPSSLHLIAKPTPIGAATSAVLVVPRLSGWLIKSFLAGSSGCSPRIEGWLIRASSSGSLPSAFHLITRPAPTTVTLGSGSLPIGVKDIYRPISSGSVLGTCVAHPRLAGWLIKGTANGVSTTGNRLVGWLLKGSSAGSSPSAHHSIAKPSAISISVGSASIPSIPAEIVRAAIASACTSSGVIAHRLEGWLFKGASAGSSPSSFHLTYRPSAIAAAAGSSSLATPVKELSKPRAFGTVSGLGLAHVDIRITIAGTSLGAGSNAASEIFRSLPTGSSVSAGAGNGEFGYRPIISASSRSSGFAGSKLPIRPLPFVVVSSLSSVVVRVRSSATASSIAAGALSDALVTGHGQIPNASAHGTSVAVARFGFRGVYVGSAITSSVEGGRLVSISSGTIGISRSTVICTIRLFSRPITHALATCFGNVAAPTNGLNRPTARANCISISAVISRTTRRVSSVMATSLSVGFEGANPADQHFTISGISASLGAAPPKQTLRNLQNGSGISASFAPDHLIARPNPISSASGRGVVSEELGATIRAPSISEAISSAVARPRIRSSVNSIASSSASVSGVKKVYRNTFVGASSGFGSVLLRIGGNVVEKALSSAVSGGSTRIEIGPLTKASSLTSGTISFETAWVPATLSISRSFAFTSKPGVFRPSIVASSRATEALAFYRETIEISSAAATSATAAVNPSCLSFSQSIGVAATSGVAGKLHVLLSPLSANATNRGRVNAQFSIPSAAKAFCTASGSVNIRLVYVPVSRASASLVIGSIRNRGLVLPLASGSALVAVSATASRTMEQSAVASSTFSSLCIPRRPYRAPSIVRTFSNSVAHSRSNQRSITVSSARSNSQLYTLNTTYRPNPVGAVAGNASILYEANQIYHGGGNEARLTTVSIGSPPPEIVVVFGDDVEL